MGSWTDYDPYTGVTDHCVMDEESGILTIHKTQDCTKQIEANKEARKTRHFDDGKKPDDIRKYCSVPIGVQYELLWKHGVDITKRDHWPRLYYLIETEYPACKVTDMRHFLGRDRKVIVG